MGDGRKNNEKNRARTYTVRAESGRYHDVRAVGKRHALLLLLSMVLTLGIYIACVRSESLLLNTGITYVYVGLIALCAGVYIYLANKLAYYREDEKNDRLTDEKKQAMRKTEERSKGVLILLIPLLLTLLLDYMLLALGFAGLVGL